MNTRLLMDSARAMVADDKGVLAMDESHPTCNKRFAKLGIPQTGETNLKAAQQALLHRARCNRAVRRGEYTTALQVDQP